jgi:hypothetical protein
MNNNAKRSGLKLRAIAVATGLSGMGLAQVDAQIASTPAPAPLYTIKEIGLNGGIYSYTNGNSQVAQNTSYDGYSNFLMGTNSQYNSSSTSGSSLGNDLWVYHNGTLELAGLVGSAYPANSYNLSGTFYNNTTVFDPASSPDGNIIAGTNARYASSNSSSSAGTDTWVMNVATNTVMHVGLNGNNNNAATGTYYSHATTGGNVFQAETFNGYQLNAYLPYTTGEPLATNTGFVAGLSARYNGSSATSTGSEGTDVWVANANTGVTYQAGLTGGIYQSSWRGANYASASVLAVYSDGTAVGTSSRLAPLTANTKTSVSATFGTDAWVQPFGGSAIEIGLFNNSGGGAQGTPDPYDYYANSSSGALRVSGIIGNGGGKPIGASYGGVIYGYSNRYNTTGGAIGKDYWFTTESTAATAPATVVGLFGAVNNYSSGAPGSFPARGTAASVESNTGILGGSDQRYDSSGNSIGFDAWIASPTFTSAPHYTIQVGLTTANTGNAAYSFTSADGTMGESSGVSYISNSGIVTGTTYRYYNGYNGTGTGPGSYNQDCFIASATVPSQQIGLTDPVGGPSVYLNTTYNEESSSVLGMNLKTGMVAGSSIRYGGRSTISYNQGTDLWIAYLNGSAAVTKQVGLVGAGYTYNTPNAPASWAPYENSTFYASGQTNLPTPSNSGQIIGTSDRSDGVNSLGADAWISSPRTPGTGKMISLSGLSAINPGQGDNYEYETYTTSSAAGLPLRQAGFYTSGGLSTHIQTDTGQVIGYNNTYQQNSIIPTGTVSWYYDSATGVTTSLDFGRTDDPYVMATDLLPDGIVLGTYNNSQNVPTAFWWSLASGEHDLGTLPATAVGVSGSPFQSIYADVNQMGNYWNTIPLDGSSIIGYGATFNAPAGRSMYLLSTTAQAGTIGMWSSNNGGSWGNAANWLNSNVPSGARAVAELIYDPMGITAASSITLDRNLTLGRIVFNNTNSYSLDPGSVPSSTLTIDDTNDITGVSPSITVAGGSHFINVPISLATNAGTGVLVNNTINTFAGTTLTLNGPVSAAAGTSQSLTSIGAGTLIFSAGASLSVPLIVNDGTHTPYVDPNTLDIITYNASGSVVFAAQTNANAGILIRNIPSLTITNSFASVQLGQSLSHGSRQVLVTQLSIAGSSNAWTGLLDLTNNDLDLPNGNLTNTWNQLAEGYNAGGWNGENGIISSTAANDSTHLTTLGVIQNSHDQSPTGSALLNSFDGQSVLPSDVLVKYTYYGDTDLSGVVDGSDYSRIDFAYLNNLNTSNLQLTGWFNGDFNYDGVIDGSDYTLMDNAFNTQGVSLSATVAPLAITTAQIAGSGTAAVPEPATLGAGSVIALGLLGRRRILR